MGGIVFGSENSYIFIYVSEHHFGWPDESCKLHYTESFTERRKEYLLIASLELASWQD